MGRILIIEDDKTLAQLFDKFIKENGHDSIVAYRGYDGLNILAEKEVDIVVLDLSLPDVPGMKVLQNIQEQFPDVRVIIITGVYHDIETAIKAFREGVVDYLLKTIDMEMLSKKLLFSIQKTLQQASLEKNLRKVGGETRDVSIVFADVQGFTRIVESNKNKPEELLISLNDLFDSLSSVVYSYGGVVDKFVGDCVFSVFENHERFEQNHCERATFAAVEMRRVASSVTFLEGPNILLNIGINSGKVIGGLVGSMWRKEYTIFGDVVNAAARLAETAHDGKILLTKNTCSQLDSALFESLKMDFYGDIKVKNREELLSTYVIK